MGRCRYLQFPYLSDNYGVLVHDAETGKTAAIDAGDDASIWPLYQRPASRLMRFGLHIIIGITPMGLPL